MSTTFRLNNERYLFDDEGNETGELYVNFSNANAREVITWLGLPGGHESQPCGEVRGMVLKRACERYLMMPIPALEQEIQATRHNNFIDGGQDRNSFSRRVRALLELAHKAGELGLITYG